MTRPALSALLMEPIESRANGQFGKPDFRYVSEDDVYICPAGQTLSFISHKRQADGPNLRRYATEACTHCALKARCTSSTHRVITRWEHEHLVDDVQRLDENPQAMRQRRETVEHPFGTIKMRLGATHFLMKRLKNVRTETALSVLAYNLTRVINILGITPLIQATRA
jgi:transposase